MTLELKRGDTLWWECAVTEDDAITPVDITGWSIRSHIRGHDGTLLAELTVDILDAGAGTYRLSHSDTTDFAPGLYRMDIEYTDAGARVLSTETGVLRLLPDETLPA